MACDWVVAACRINRLVGVIRDVGHPGAVNIASQDNHVVDGLATIVAAQGIDDALALGAVVGLFKSGAFLLFVNIDLRIVPRALLLRRAIEGLPQILIQFSLLSFSFDFLES